MSDITTAVRGCLHCGHELPARSRTGRPRVYCDKLCRDRARRRRDAAAGKKEYVCKPRSEWKVRGVRVNRTGQRFASMTILKHLHGGRALCKCDCGNEKVMHVRNLVIGMTINCADRSNHPDPRSKGRDIGYWAAHHRVTAARGPASDHKCRLCPKQASQWAYGHGADGQAVDESGREAGLPFSPDPLDYWPLCRSHHHWFDMARARFPKGDRSLVHFAFWALLRQGEELHELENGSVA